MGMSSQAGLLGLDQVANIQQGRIEGREYRSNNWTS
jgi:hypothetical protein